MASLVLLKNPLAPHTREAFPLEPGTPVIDWLREHHPQGFGMPVRFYLNGEEQALDDLDHRLGADDVAIIALMPGAAPALVSIGINLLIAAALSVASYFLNEAFAPKQKSGKKSKEVTVYDVSTDQNGARIGDAIPVVYGTVLTSPDYVAQPYTWFDWNPSTGYSSIYNGIQYLDMVLCVGQGNIDVENIYLGDTASQTPDSGVVSWQTFKPSEHTSMPGVISAAMGSRFYENVVTSAEVSNQEFVNAGDAAGYFAASKPGVIGDRIELDIVFPNGQFDPDGSGDIRGRRTNFTVYYQEIDDNDVPIGGVYTKVWTSDTGANGGVTGPDDNSIFNTSITEKNKSALIAPLRRTYRFQTPSVARWQVKLLRNSSAPNAQNGTDRFIWAGLRFRAAYPSTPLYGDVTLLAVRVKASQGLGNDASIRIRARCTRRLEPPAGGTEAATTSPAWAFADAYANTVYGANRPRSELDTATLDALHTRWQGAGYQFNYVFRDRTTVWEALRTIATPFAAEPLPIGPVMSVAQDGVKPVRSMLFTDANIVAGTLNVNYSWDEEGAADGVEIEYVDPKDFRQVYTRFPTTSLRPDQFSLPGVTSATHAAQYARLTWQRRQGQRKSVTFDTELEGLLLQMGDRIGIAHNVPKWGDSGLVLGMDGTTLTVDHDLDWFGGTKQMLLRRPDGSVTDAITVTPGAANNLVVLPSPTPTTIHYDDAYEYTSFAFGSSTTLVRDFIVTSVTPTGEGTVTVEAVNYNPDIFTGTLTYTV